MSTLTPVRSTERCERPPASPRPIHASKPPASNAGMSRSNEMRPRTGSRISSRSKPSIGAAPIALATSHEGLTASPPNGSKPDSSSRMAPSSMLLFAAQSTGPPMA